MNLFYRQVGQGNPTLIILHGLFGSSDNWLTIAKQLAQDYTIFLIDQRNHGQSAWSVEWDYQAMSDDIVLFMQQHNIIQPIVVGHSMGGKTAMLLATQHPHLLAKLVVVDIAPKYYPIHHDKIISGLQALDIMNLPNRQEADKALAYHIPETDTRQFLLKNLYRTEDNRFAWRMNLDIIAQKIANIGEALPTDARFDKPTLFIRGAKSNYILEADIALIKQHFAQAQICTIQEAGHWVQAEQPQQFIEVLHNFVS